MSPELKKDKCHNVNEIDAFEVQFYRKILRIPCAVEESNKNTRKLLNMNKPYLLTLTKRKIL